MTTTLIDAFLPNQGLQTTSLGASSREPFQLPRYLPPAQATGWNRQSQLRHTWEATSRAAAVYVSRR